VSGTSGGALVGAYFLSGGLDIVKKKMLSYDSVDRILKPWVDLSFVPFIGTVVSRILSIFIGIFKNGLFKKQFLYEMVRDISENNDPSWSSKLYVSLVNYESGTIVHHNSLCKTKEDIETLKSYIVGSMSLWGVFPPEKIKGTHYVDGGLLDLYPFNARCKNKWRLKEDELFLIIDTQIYSENDGEIIRPRTFNVLKSFIVEYLTNLLSISASANGHLILCNYLIHNKNIIHIPYPDPGTYHVCRSSIEYNKISLEHTYQEGLKKGHAFLESYEH